MTAKRNTRSYVDEAAHHTGPSHQQVGDGSQKPQPDEEAGLASLPKDVSSALSSLTNQTNQALEKEVVVSALPKGDKWPAAAPTGPSIPPSMQPLFPQPSVQGSPANFGVVVPGIYRSSYPKAEDYDFLRDLALKTVVTLVKKDEIDHDFEAFLAKNGVRQVVFNMKGTKKEAIPLNTMSSILGLVLDQRNSPLLIHCNHGKHRTGCVVAAIRKVCGWDLDMVLDEYNAFATPKVRECDVKYITSFRMAPLQPTLPLIAVVSNVRFTPTQMRSFFRTLMFSAIVTTIWMVSGSWIMTARERSPR